jgi:hypothetical protein
MNKSETLIKKLTQLSHFILLLVTLYSLLPTLLFAQSGWSEDMRLTFDYAYNVDPRADCCGDTIHLVWWKNYLDSLSIFHDEVYYMRSTDAGQIWEGNARLSIEDEQWSRARGIAVVDSVIHVIWYEEDFGLLYRRSMDGGSTWVKIDSVAPGMTYASICAVGDTVYIAGTNGSTGDLQFTKSYDGGNSWQPVIDITKASSSPRIRTISNDVLSLVVSYDKGGSPVCTEVYQVLSYDGGGMWFDSVMISYYDSAGSQRPAMDTDDSTGVHITWYDYKYSPYPWTGDIFYRASRDSGVTWEEIDSLTIMHRATASDILAEKNDLHLVWEDDRNEFNVNREIYYRMSTNFGQSWGSELRLTNAPYHSRRPSLTCGSDYLHLFWSDQRDNGNSGPWALYYKRKDLSQAIRETDILSLLSTLKFYVTPNPFRQTLSVEYGVGCNAKGVGLKIFDILGKEVVYYDLNEKTDRITIDTKDLSCGVYFVQIQAGGESGMKKVVKVK